MTPADRKRFIGIVVGFAELKGKQLSAQALELYWRSMQRWSIEDFSAAAEQLLRTCEFFPTPADFEKLRKAALPTAGEAWAKVVEYVRQGWYRWDDGSVSESISAGRVPPDEKSVAAVAALGGYRVIALTDEDKLPFIERRFCEHYEAIQDAMQVREQLPQLAAPERRHGITGPQPLTALLPFGTKQ